MTIFSMDHGNLDSIVPWMDSNYGNSNLQLCFPMEKHIASLPVPKFLFIGLMDFIVNFSLMGLMDFIVKHKSNMDSSNMVTNPWINLDSYTLRTKPVSLPRTAGVVHPERFILPVGRWRNKGRDITAVEAEPDNIITPERAEIVQPWKSRKRRASPEAGPSYERATPELRPVLGPVPLREPGEREHQNYARLTKAARRVHFKDGVLPAAVANPEYGSCSGHQPTQGRQMTQDEVEEVSSYGICEDDNMLNFDYHTDSEMELYVFG